MTIYSTSMSAQARWLGLTTVAILVVALVILFGRDAGQLVGPYLGSVLVLILGVTYLVSTREYEIGDGKLVARKVIGCKSFELRGTSVGRDALAASAAYPPTLLRRPQLYRCTRCQRA